MLEKPKGYDEDMKVVEEFPKLFKNLEKEVREEAEGKGSDENIYFALDNIDESFTDLNTYVNRYTRYFLIDKEMLKKVKDIVKNIEDMKYNKNKESEIDRRIRRLLNRIKPTLTEIDSAGELYSDEYYLNIMLGERFEYSKLNLYNIVDYESYKKFYEKSNEAVKEKLSKRVFYSVNYIYYKGKKLSTSKYSEKDLDEIFKIFTDNQLPLEFDILKDYVKNDAFNTLLDLYETSEIYHEKDNIDFLNDQLSRLNLNINKNSYTDKDIIDKSREQDERFSKVSKDLSNTFQKMINKKSSIFYEIAFDNQEHLVKEVVNDLINTEDYKKYKIPFDMNSSFKISFANGLINKNELYNKFISDSSFRNFIITNIGISKYVNYYKNKELFNSIIELIKNKSYSYAEDLDTDIDALYHSTFEYNEINKNLIEDFCNVFDNDSVDDYVIYDLTSKRVYEVTNIIINNYTEFSDDNINQIVTLLYSVVDEEFQIDESDLPAFKYFDSISNLSNNDIFDEIFSSFVNDLETYEVYDIMNNFSFINDIGSETTDSIYRAENSEEYGDEGSGSTQSYRVDKKEDLDMLIENINPIISALYRAKKLNIENVRKLFKQYKNNKVINFLLNFMKEHDIVSVNNKQSYDKMLNILQYINLEQQNIDKPFNSDWINQLIKITNGLNPKVMNKKYNEYIKIVPDEFKEDFISAVKNNRLNKLWLMNIDKGVQDSDSTGINILNRVLKRDNLKFYQRNYVGSQHLPPYRSSAIFGIYIDYANEFKNHSSGHPVAPSGLTVCWVKYQVVDGIVFIEELQNDLMKSLKIKKGMDKNKNQFYYTEITKISLDSFRQYIDKEFSNDTEILMPTHYNRKKLMGGSGVVSAYQTPPSQLGYKLEKNHFRDEDVYIVESKKINESLNNYIYIELFDKILYETISDVIKNKPKQKWNYINFFRLKKILDDYIKFKFVRDEKGLNQIKNIIIQNIVKIDVNTNLLNENPNNRFGNTHYLEMYIENIENDFEGDVEDLDDLIHSTNYFDDDDGEYRVTNSLLMGTDKLVDLCIQLIGEKKPENIIMIINKVLNLTHPRSDVASWFLPNGSDDYDKLSGNVNESPDVLYYNNNVLTKWVNGNPLIIWGNKVYEGLLGDTHSKLFIEEIIPDLKKEDINKTVLDNALDFAYNTLNIDIDEITERLPNLTIEYKEIDEDGEYYETEEIVGWNSYVYDEHMNLIFDLIIRDEEEKIRPFYIGENVRVWYDVYLNNKNHSILSSWKPHTDINSIKQTILKLDIEESDYKDWLFDVDDYSLQFDEDYFIQPNEHYISFENIFNGLPEVKLNPDKEKMFNDFLQHLDFGRTKMLSKDKEIAMDRFKNMDNKKNPMAYDKKYRKFNNPNYVKDKKGNLVEKITNLVFNKLK